MSSTSHTAATGSSRAPYVRKMTPGQLKRIVERYVERSISFDYAQMFVNDQLVPKNPEAQSIVRLGQKNDWSLRLEEHLCENFPEHAEALAKDFSAVLSSDLDLEFRPGLTGEREFGDTVSSDLTMALALTGWLGEVKFWFMEIYVGFSNQHFGEMQKLLAEKMYGDVVEALDKVNPALVHETKRASLWFTPIENHLTKRINATGAVKYGLLKRLGRESLIWSIRYAMFLIVLFTVNKDQERLRVAKAFLQLQTSGNPFVGFRNGTAYILAAPKID